MSKFSMNNIFEDRAFIMFDGVERAYFVEENTGQISFIYRFAKQEERAREEASISYIVNMYAFLVGLPLAILWGITVPSLNSFYISYASIMNNSLLLLGVMVLAATLSFPVKRNMYKKNFENYLKVARNYLPIVVEDREREHLLKRARKRAWFILIVFVPILAITVWTGYAFVTTSNLGLLILSPLGTFVLLMIVSYSKDRWTGRKITRRMLSDIRRECGGHGG